MTIRRLKQQLRDFTISFVRPQNLLYRPELLEKPPGENVVVVAPHFDDDIIGCGGTLRKHILAGGKVTVIYLTDGREGDPDCADKRAVERQRKQEAKAATSILGIEQLVFMDEPETKLTANAKLIDRLQTVLNDLRPDLIYIPSMVENHIDHFEANRILAALAPRLSFLCNIAAYEVWTPLLPNIVVDISGVAEEKAAALQQYVSQLKQVDYAGTAMALNRYRSGAVMHGKGFAEAFFYVTIKEYLAILRQQRIKSRVFI